MVKGPNTEDRIINEIIDNTDDNDLAVNMVESTEYQPTYKMIADTRIPVSKSAGALWKSRRDIGIAKLEKSGKLALWEEAITYYKNDQSIDRKTGVTGSAISGRRSTRISENGQGESENIVFANTSALVPAIYAKNPTCEITANYRDDSQPEGRDDRLKALAETGERLVNTLSQKRASPGINLKPKARKLVIMATLTNLGYLEVGYTRRENGSEQALMDLDRISRELVETKDQNEIQRLEGELEALEERIDFLRSSGPWVKFRHPKDVVRDPDSVESDLSDAKWVMVADYVATSYINAVYREKAGHNEWRSIYKPTHVVPVGGGTSIDDEINSFSLLKGNMDYRTFGYNDEATYDKACRTKVWYVWDKITRRVYMFNDQDWSWPIWVWDDPYRLDAFFTLVPLEFYTDPEDDIGKSEVAYYLDQQDGINEINNEMRKIRKRAMGTVFYNRNLVKDASMVDAYIKGTDVKSAVGIDAPADADLQKLFFAMLPPSAQFTQLFDKTPFLEAINRVSSVQPVLQGQQFKTNTTNDAIETYNSAQQTRLDEKIDAMEDCIGSVLWAVLQLCLQFMSQEEVAEVIGDRDASLWANLSPEEIRKNFSVRVVGGSSQKPTSKAKKQEAMQMGQILGQYANAGNGAALLLVLKVFERAFDELVITTEDWQFMQQAIATSLQNSNPQGQPTDGAAPSDPATAPAPDGGGAPGLDQLAALIDQLPPEAKDALGTALSRGVPLAEALPRILELAQAAATGATQ